VVAVVVTRRASRVVAMVGMMGMVVVRAAVDGGAGDGTEERGRRLLDVDRLRVPVVVIDLLLRRVVGHLLGHRLLVLNGLHHLLLLGGDVLLLLHRLLLLLRRRRDVRRRGTRGDEGCLPRALSRRCVVVVEAAGCRVLVGCPPRLQLHGRWDEWRGAETKGSIWSNDALLLGNSNFNCCSYALCLAVKTVAVFVSLLCRCW